MLFDRQVYDDRLRRAADAAAAEGFAALLVADPANLYYLTGYDAWSFYMPQVLLLDADTAEATFLLREMDANGAHRITVPGVELVGYPERLVHRRDEHPGDWMAAWLRERGDAERYRGGVVGYEGEAHFFAVRTFRAFAEGLPEWTLRDCQGTVNRVRLRKEDREIELMRGAGRIVSNCMAVAVDAIRAGARQNDVAAEILAAQARGVGEIEGDYTAIVPMLPTGEAADTPHLTYSASRFRDGEGVSIEIAAAHRRYHAPLARTVALGRVHPDLERLGDVTAEGLDKVLAAVRPGVTAGEVAEVYWRHLADHGLEKASRLGYSIGIGYPPDWGEGTASIRIGDETVLERNMTFHVIAGMWQTGYGCELSESIAVTEDGVEVLTDAPRALIRKAGA